MKKNVVGYLWVMAALTLAGTACQKAPAGLPDLYVEGVTCRGGNLALAVGNKGGPLPDGWRAAAAISVDGSPQEVFPLTLSGEEKLGAFAKGKGALIFLTAARITQISGVSVSLDYSNEIEEADETNNTVMSWHVHPCDLPDLVIEDLSLDENCMVRVTVKNAGEGPIGEPAWSYEFLDYCGVSIYVDGKEVACVPFLSFDAERRVKPVGGRALLKSMIKIAKESVVLAVVDSTQVIAESNEMNNRASATLGCGGGAPSLP